MEGKQNIGGTDIHIMAYDSPSQRTPRKILPNYVKVFGSTQWCKSCTPQIFEMELQKRVSNNLVTSHNCFLTLFNLTRFKVEFNRERRPIMFLKLKCKEEAGSLLLNLMKFSNIEKNSAKLCKTHRKVISDVEFGSMKFWNWNTQGETK